MWTLFIGLGVIGAIFAGLAVFAWAFAIFVDTCVAVAERYFSQS